jgi:hypothetical protein
MRYRIRIWKQGLEPDRRGALSCPLQSVAPDRTSDPPMTEATSPDGDVTPQMDKRPNPALAYISLQHQPKKGLEMSRERRRASCEVGRASLSSRGKRNKKVVLLPPRVLASWELDCDAKKIVLRVQLVVKELICKPPCSEEGQKAQRSTDRGEGRGREGWLPRNGR